MFPLKYLNHACCWYTMQCRNVNLFPVLAALIMLAHLITSVFFLCVKAKVLFLACLVPPNWSQVPSVFLSLWHHFQWLKLSMWYHHDHCFHETCINSVVDKVMLGQGKTLWFQSCLTLTLFFCLKRVEFSDPVEF